jgi:predicted MFS family arabinose efflux permease
VQDYLEKIDLRKVVRYTLFMFLTLMAQNMVFSHIRPFGVRPLLLPSAAAAVGMFEGATWGPLFSLVMGYFADMSFVEHRVFFLLLLPALSLLSAFMSQFFINRRFFAFMGIAFVALLITGLLQMLKTLAGDAWSLEMLKVVGLQTLVSLPPAALAYPLPARWSRE